MAYKTKGELDWEKLEKIREEYGDTFLLEKILAWWGYEDSTQFLEENAEELGIEEEEEKEKWELLEDGWFETDDGQYCRELEENEMFEFAQKGASGSWVVQKIILSVYSYEEKMEYMSPYGYEELQDPQIVAECIFETDFLLV